MRESNISILFSISRLAVVTAVLLIISPVSASETFRWKTVEGDKNFQPIRAHLQHLVDSDAKAKVNRLCVIGQKQAGRYVNAYVYWPTMNKLILWEPNSDTLDDIAMSRRYLDLKTDVAVGSVHGSSYQITREWADSVIRACRHHGIAMTIAKGRQGG